MYNNKGESKMDKTILVVEIIKYNTMEPNYSIKKVADNYVSYGQSITLAID